MKFFEPPHLPREKWLPKRTPQFDKLSLYKSKIETGRWKKLTVRKRKIDPACEPCKAKGRYTPATEVHHIKPITSHPHLAYVWSNLQSICRECHKAVTHNTKFQFLYH